jgi:hypothetical protein
MASRPSVSTWAQHLCLKFGRADFGDQKIGELLSAPKIGADGVWPCEQVRNVLEECSTTNLTDGFQIGAHNSRGVHARGEGGVQERALAERYRNWSLKLAFEYPHVASMVEGIAQTYDRQAEMEDSDAAIRRRLRL